MWIISVHSMLVLTEQEVGTKLEQEGALTI